MTLFVFLLSLGAALRLTHLAVDDSITAVFRTFLARRAYAEGHPLQNAVGKWFVQLFECPWCIGFWISGAVAAAALHVDPQPQSLWWTFPALTLTLSYLVGVCATVLYTIEEL